MDLSGCWLRGGTVDGSFRIPDGTSLALEDSEWVVLPGTVRAEGSMVMLTDQTTSSTGKRFYQILIVPEPL